MLIINKKIHTNTQDIKKRLKIILKSYKKMNHIKREMKEFEKEKDEHDKIVM